MADDPQQRRTLLTCIGLQACAGRNSGMGSHTAHLDLPYPLPPAVSEELPR